MNACINTTEHQENSIKEYQHQIYAVFYTVILVPGLIGNVLALWVFYAYIKETKKAVIFMTTWPSLDLLQVLSLPLRILLLFEQLMAFRRRRLLAVFLSENIVICTLASTSGLASVEDRCRLIIHPLRCSATKRRRERGLVFNRVVHRFVWDAFPSLFCGNPTPKINSALLSYP